jgi:drug/metabolite transporter (DMT)-like permease
VAACSNAASNVIQRATNRDESEVKTLSLKLVKDLLHRPLWFAGIGAVTLSFLLQATALRFGPLALVQPLLVCELPLTFVGAALFLGARLGVREWGTAVVMTVGLATLVFFLDPHAGTNGHAPPYAWAIGLGASEGVVVAAVLAGRRASGDRRAAMYGVGTGAQFGTTAALMKGAVGFLPGGAGALFASWQTYAMVAGGICGMFLMQNAMQAGRLVAAQPGITLTDPFVAIIWGLVGFHEEATPDPVHVGVAAAGGALMVVGALLLSRSRVLQRHGRHTSGEGRAVAARAPARSGGG